MGFVKLPILLSTFQMQIQYGCVLHVINLYILRSCYANEAEGLEYNGKQCKSFGTELVLDTLGDQPETYSGGYPNGLDCEGLGCFFFLIFFRRENRLFLRTFFHCLLSGGLVSLRVFCFLIQFCPVQIPSLSIRSRYF